MLQRTLEEDIVCRDLIHEPVPHKARVVRIQMKDDTTGRLVMKFKSDVQSCYVPSHNLSVQG